MTVHENLSSQDDLFADHGSKLFVLVVAAAYIVTLVSENRQWSLVALVLWLSLGLVYIAIGLYGWEYSLRELKGRTSIIVAYFVGQIALATVIIYLADGGNGVWLLPLPLIAQAAADLPTRWTFVVGVGILAAWTSLLYYWTGGGVAQIVANSVLFVPALAFTAYVMRVAVREQKSRREVERLARELGQANQQLRHYATQIEELATSKERNRLAREIHDMLGHYLTVVNVQLEAAQTLMDRNPDRARVALDKARQLTQQGLGEIRRSVATLRESPLDGRSLPEAVGRLVTESSAAGIITELVVAGNARPLTPQTDLTLYRAAQEALTNVRKHAHASRTDIVLDYTAVDCVELSIRDNGVGTAVTDGGFGLLGIQERVHLLGGKLSIETATGAGFHLQIQLPTANHSSRPAAPR